jgi:hypothetical protein
MTRKSRDEWDEARSCRWVALKVNVRGQAPNRHVAEHDDMYPPKYIVLPSATISRLKTLQVCRRCNSQGNNDSCSGKGSLNVILPSLRSIPSTYCYITQRYLPFDGSSVTFKCPLEVRASPLL